MVSVSSLQARSTDILSADIPLEICVRQEVNPRKVNKPVITVWCYKASPESGLAK